MENKFIKMTEAERVNFIIETLEKTFKNVVTAAFAEEKQYNNAGLPPAHYFVYGFKLADLSGWQSVTYEVNSSSVSYGFHSFIIDPPAEEISPAPLADLSKAIPAVASGSLENLVRDILEVCDYVRTGDNDAKMIARNIRKYHSSPTDEQIRAEIFAFYNA